SETRTKIGESAMQVAPSNSAPSAGFMGPPMLLPFGRRPLLQVVPVLHGLFAALTGALQLLVEHRLAREVPLGQPAFPCYGAKPLPRQGFAPLFAQLLGVLERGALDTRVLVCLVEIARALLRSDRRCREQKKNKH